MTIVEFKDECGAFAKEYWWNGAGVVVVVFLIATFIWKRPDNDYLLYAALLAVGIHSLVSAHCFERRRTDDKHRAEIAVAYRESLKLQEQADDRPDRPVTGRNGSTPSRMAYPPQRYFPLPAR